jgi:hypothetical protein
MKRIVLSLLLTGCLLSGCGTQPAETTPTPPAENTEQAQANTISPLPSTIDLTDMENRTLHVAFEEGDFHVDQNGETVIDAQVFDYELFDMVDIAGLKVGDTLVIRGEAVEVTSLDRADNGNIAVNGGIEMEGYDLTTNESGVFFEYGFNDHKQYYKVGEVTLSVSPDFLFTDNSDFDAPGVEYGVDAFTSGSELFYDFTPYNTTLVLEDGLVTAMERRFIP